VRASLRVNDSPKTPILGINIHHVPTH
jgi:hypothetical protein